MHQPQSQPAALVGPVLTALTALALFISIAISSPAVFGAPMLQLVQDRISQGAPTAEANEIPNLRGTVLEFPKTRLGPADRIAALRAFQIALTQVGDGTNYVWYRSRGRLSGVIRPVRSFADVRGRVCRELRVTLHAGRHYTRSMDGTACRNPDGTWMLGQ